MTVNTATDSPMLDRTARQAPPDTSEAGLLRRVAQLLQGAQPEAALNLLNTTARNTPALRQARGVCLLRLGQSELALKLFRELLYPQGPFAAAPDAPIELRVNFAAALLRCGQLVEGIHALQQDPQPQHAAWVQLQTAVNRWRQTLSWRQRLLLPLGLANPPVPDLGLHAGALWIPGEVPAAPDRTA